jgi:predicted RNA-binding Zn-ribbon protein involved in translation (DUF1610 family)
MADSIDDDDFVLEDLHVEIHCPKCGNEMVHDGNSLQLAVSPRGVMFECGRCAEITQWRYTFDPFTLERVEPITWGGHL